jgi:hypothetical protein
VATGRRLPLAISAQAAAAVLVVLVGMEVGTVALAVLVLPPA